MFASKDEAGHLEVLAPEDKAGWPEVFTETFWRTRPDGQRCPRKQNIRYRHGRKRKTEELTHNNGTVVKTLF